MQILSLILIQTIATLLQQYSYLQKRKLEHGVGCNANPRVVNMFLLFGLFCEFCMLMFLPICLFALINSFQIIGFFVYAFRDQKSKYQIGKKQVLGILFIMVSVILGYLFYGFWKQYLSEPAGLEVQNYYVLYGSLCVQIIVLIFAKLLKVKNFMTKVIISSSFIIQTLSNLKILAISLKLVLQQKPQIFSPMEIFFAFLAFALFFEFQANLTFQSRKNNEASVFMILWLLTVQFISITIISPFIFMELNEVGIWQFGTLIAGFLFSFIGCLLLTFNEVSSVFRAQGGLNYYKEINQ